MLDSALLCVVALLNNLLQKNFQAEICIKACWLTMLKKSRIFVKIFVSKLKNAEGMVITLVVETSFKIFD